MVNAIDEAIEKLPTLSSRLAAVATVALSPPSFYLPQFLRPLLWPTMSESDLVLFQGISVVLEFSLGSLVAFLIVRFATPKSFWENK